MESILSLAYDWLDKGLVPDFLVRIAIRALLKERLREINYGSFGANLEHKMQWIEKVRQRDVIADETEKANEQHYEVSTKFMLTAVGPRAKYSCCLYPTGSEDLATAEDLMLESYCDKARLADGLDILDLGCGWGSLSLYLAKKYPQSKIVGLSNSKTQKLHIDAEARRQGLTNLEIITADVNTFDFNGTRSFDRILSIEMLEHMKNYEALLRKISGWMKSTADCKAGEAIFFAHILSHKSMPYDFEGDGWMAKHFFSGGTMPSHDTLAYFQSDLTLIRSWWINGRHYAQTCEDWLKLQDKNAALGKKELEDNAETKGFGRMEGRKTFYRFRVFFMAGAELFAFNDGDEWGVTHLLFKKRQ